jgi:hypothetical protein
LVNSCYPQVWTHPLNFVWQTWSDVIDPFSSQEATHRSLFLIIWACPILLHAFNSPVTHVHAHWIKQYFLHLACALSFIYQFYSPVNFIVVTYKQHLSEVLMFSPMLHICSLIFFVYSHLNRCIA